MKHLMVISEMMNLILQTNIKKNKRMFFKDSNNQGRIQSMSCLLNDEV